jgi:hypothetical protein
MDQAVRNKLRNVVTQCRKLLEDAVAQVLQGQFGIYATGKKEEVHVEDESRMTHLAEEDRACRRDLLDHFEHIQALGYKPKDALAQLVREVAFTHLNRLCAYKMMEARGVVINGRPFREAVSRGLKSQGFLFYLAEQPEDEKQYNSGHQDVAYRHFLDWLGGTLSEEIGVLFSPNDPANRLYPPQRVLDDVLDLLNTGDIKPEEKELQEAWPTIWSADETIGWVYQYFTPKELRDQARKESAAPRNSYELAFRNQFFTPRYVVEFLTDNTLGRIWYEMRMGQTRLKDQCRYMVRRPNEVFLAEGQEPPEEAQQGTDDLPQEELLKLPTLVAHRPKKDPRELRILDPACGSGHFLLYCFDLLETVYEEAYDDPDLGPALKSDYPTRGDLWRAVPGLILARNLHGIDIDRRATQIAALALWLRCHRAYQEREIKKQRPRITKSNIVCAEPMPGEKEMLKEFVANVQPQILGHLVEVVFDKMQLAGEAGSLLKVEEELRGAIAAAKRQWVAEHERAVDRKGRTLLFSQAEMERVKNKSPQPQLFDFSEITEEQFWNEAESRVVEALRDYSSHAANGGKLLRRLFAEDAAHGFAFIDVCQRRFDVVLMNPPFGMGSPLAKAYYFAAYPVSKNDLFAAFVERAIALSVAGGLVGAISSRTGFFLSSFQEWRNRALYQDTRLTAFADLGAGVLDTAMVETAAYCITKSMRSAVPCFCVRLLREESKDQALQHAVDRLSHGEASPEVFSVYTDSLRGIPCSPLAYWISPSVRRLFREEGVFENEQRTARCGLGTTDNFRFLRLRWEVPNAVIGSEWVAYFDGGAYSPIYDDFYLVVWWRNDGEEIKQFIAEKFGSASRKVQGEDRYFTPGFVFPRRTKGLAPKIMPRGGIYSNSGQAGFAPAEELYWTIGLLASQACSYLVALSQGRTGDAAQFEVGQIKRLPWPEARATSNRQDLEAHVQAILARKREMASADELSSLFVSPATVALRRGSLQASIECVQDRWQQAAIEIRENHEQIDELGFDIFGFDARDREAVASHIGPTIQPPDESEEDSEASVDEAGPSNGLIGARGLVEDIISYCIGCVFGRWDIRLAFSDSPPTPFPDPFAAIPSHSVGMLTFPRGVVPKGYPIKVDTDGIIVDEADNADDIVGRVREVLEAVWGEAAEAIEGSACDVLAVRHLREYFQRNGSNGFWHDHIKRYSKRYRRAPIYWLLQSSKKSYALWVYYHRLDKDILFKTLLYVETKIRLEENELTTMRAQKGAAGKAAKKFDKDIDKQENLLSELRDFEDKLRRAANLHLEPDLNDGVVLNIAPLWELVPWREAKGYWEELLEGKYEWSSIGKQLREKGLVK